MFSIEHLKIEWAKLYELACSLEHATAPEVTEALAEFLGDPKFCPRGNPIPSSDGSLTLFKWNPAWEAPVGAMARVLAVNATKTDVLKYLQERGILPGCELTILEAAPMEGPLTLKVNDKEIAVGLLLSEFVIVEVK